MKDKKQVILLVDDSTENIDVLGSILTDYKRVIALNGEKALEIINAGNLPDLILLDIEMPGIDGFEVCKRIRKNSTYDNIPIIFLSGKTDKESTLNGFELGGQDYITKPFDKNELLVRVKTQLELKASRERLENINTELDTKVEEQTKELELINNLNIRFLNYISTEIRKPLNDLKGPIYLLKEKLGSTDLIDLLLVLDNSVKTLEDFSDKAAQITEIRKVSELSIEDCNLKEIVEFALFELDEKINEKNILLETNLQDFIASTNLDYLKDSLTFLLGFIIDISENDSTLKIMSGKSSLAINGKIKEQESAEALNMDNENIDIKVFFAKSFFARFGFNYQVQIDNLQYELIIQ